MHILFILEHYHPNIGGVETLFKSLVDALNERGVQTTVITTNNHGLPKVEVDGLNTIRRYRFGSRYLFTFLSVFPILMNGGKADVIHTTSYNAGLPASLAGWLLRKPVVITFHEVWGRLWFKLPYFSWISKTLHYLFEQFLLKCPFKRFVAVSEFTANRLIKYGIPAEKVSVIYNGIDYQKWTSTESSPLKKKDTYHFLYFGRLGISKGLDILTKAFASLAKRHPEARLTLVLPTTPKSLLTRIRDEVNAIPESQRPTIMHELPHDELKYAISAADAIVIPSYSEGFGYTAAESVAMNKNIISSGRGALREVAGGNMIEMNEHSAKGLEQAMEKAINGKWEFVSPTNFHLTDTVDQYVKLYRGWNKNQRAHEA